MIDFNTILAGLAEGSRGSGADFWQPELGENPVRLFVPSSYPEGMLFYPKVVHWAYGGKSTDCTGEGCEKCALVAALNAAGDKDSRQIAYDNRRQIRGVFVLVDLRDPSGFVLYEAPEGATKNLTLAVAKEAGYRGEYPKTATDLGEFSKALVGAIPKVSGAEGMDIFITKTKQKKKTLYTFDVARQPGRMLPFTNEDAPDPADILTRIADAVAAKEDSTDE